jgi:formyl-CoA transferase
VEIDAAISDWTGGRSVASALDALTRASVPASKIYTAQDIAGDPHYRARGMIQSVETRAGSKIDVPGIVPKLSTTPGVFRSAAPGLGDDTEEVLKRYGISAERIASLLKRNIIG